MATNDARDDDEGVVFAVDADVATRRPDEGEDVAIARIDREAGLRNMRRKIVIDLRPAELEILRKRFGGKLPSE